MQSKPGTYRYGSGLEPPPPQSAISTVTSLRCAGRAVLSFSMFHQSTLARDSLASRRLTSLCLFASRRPPPCSSPGLSSQWEMGVPLSSFPTPSSVNSSHLAGQRALALLYRRLAMTAERPGHPKARKQRLDPLIGRSDKGASPSLGHPCRPYPTRFLHLLVLVTFGLGSLFHTGTFHHRWMCLDQRDTPQQQTESETWHGQQSLSATKCALSIRPPPVSFRGLGSRMPLVPYATTRLQIPATRINKVPSLDSAILRTLTLPIAQTSQLPFANIQLDNKSPRSCAITLKTQSARGPE